MCGQVLLESDTRMLRLEGVAFDNGRSLRPSGEAEIVTLLAVHAQGQENAADYLCQPFGTRNRTGG